MSRAIYDEEIKLFKIVIIVVILLFLIMGVAWCCAGRWGKEPKPLDEIIGSSSVDHSWLGTVIDRSDQTIIQAGQPRYVILHFNGIWRGSINGAHFKSIESVCEVYCN